MDRKEREEEVFKASKILIECIKLNDMTSNIALSAMITVLANYYRQANDVKGWHEMLKFMKESFDEEIKNDEKGDL